MDLAQDYRLKVLALNWNPSRAEWIAAGGAAAQWDAAEKAGGAANGVAMTLGSVQAQIAGLRTEVTQLRNTPPGSGVITDEQLERVLRRVMGSVDGSTPTQG